MTPGNERRERKNRASFRAVVYDRRNKKKLSRTFDTITAAKQWRTDAIVALRAGTISTERGPLLRDYAAEWLDGLDRGTIRNRGRRTPTRRPPKVIDPSS